MNPRLRNRLAAVIAAAGTGGAISIATVMIGSGDDGLKGLRHLAYHDVVGVPTVCYGHTGPDVRFGHYYTTAECDAILDKDLRIVAGQVDPLLKVPVTPTQRAALYSFVYNVGIGNFRSSTMLKYINAGKYAESCNELQRWVYAGGVPWKGLISRREVEKQVCEWQQQPVKLLLSGSSKPA